jgi:predicted enzyme related to lactoylglutathione lyase
VQRHNPQQQEKGSVMPPTFANGKICYLQIPATDIAVSSAFYAAVFGWKLRKRGNGEVTFDDGVGEVSGMWVLDRRPSPEPGIIIYIMVDSATATVTLVTAHGGQIVKPIDPKAPEITAQFRDPGGNILGIFQQRG